MSTFSCHLLQKTPLTSADLSLKENFSFLKIFEDESHEKKYLLSCNKCGQLYYFCFHEEIDMIGGNDPQYSVLVPIENEEIAKKLLLLSKTEFGAYSPRIVKDFPSDADEPTIFLA